MEIEFRHAYSNFDVMSEATALLCADPTLAQQHCKDECDINNILRQFAITGKLPESPLSPQYGDFTEVTDYHTALNAVKAAEEEFLTLPAEMREKFDNDPQKLIDFLGDESNRGEAEKMGLIEPRTQDDQNESIAKAPAEKQE